jgi:Tol biopolymer transport system component
LYTVDLATKTQTQRTNTPGVFESDPDWASTDEIVFTADGTLFVAPLKNMNNRKPLLSTPSSLPDFEPEWVLGGKQILFNRGYGRTVDGSPLSDIWLVDVNGSSPINLTNDANKHSSHGRVQR